MAQTVPIPDAIRAQLLAGEQVLWAGQPPQGMWRGSMPIGWRLIYFLGFSVAFVGGWMPSGDTRQFLGLVGIPLMLIGIVGSFVFGARQRARTHFALTSERLMVVGRSGRGCIESISLLTLPGLSLTEEKSGGRGTVSLGFTSWPGSKRNGTTVAGYPGMQDTAPLQFNKIADARRVYQMIRDAQQRVWEQHFLEPSGGQPASAEAVQAARIPAAIGDELSASEQVLWLGQPRRQGLMLRPADKSGLVTLLVVLLIGFLCFLWFAPPIPRKEPGFGPVTVLFILFMLLMLVMFVGRFVGEMRWLAQTQTRYALTNERVMIVREPGSVQSINLRTLSDLSLTEGRGGHGTVWLAPKPPPWADLIPTEVLGRNTPYLDTISDAQRVYQLIRDAQQRVRTET
jgi:hypothetical protein